MMQWVRSKIGIEAPTPPTEESPSIINSRQTRQEIRARTHLIETRSDEHIKAIFQVKDDIEQGRTPNQESIQRLRRVSEGPISETFREAWRGRHEI